MPNGFLAGAHERDSPRASLSGVGWYPAGVTGLRGGLGPSWGPDL